MRIIWFLVFTLFFALNIWFVPQRAGFCCAPRRGEVSTHRVADVCLRLCLLCRINQSNDSGKTISVGVYTLLLCFGMPLIGYTMLNFFIELSPFWRTWCFLFEYFYTLAVVFIGIFNAMQLGLDVLKLDVTDIVGRMKGKQKFQFGAVLGMMLFMVLGQSVIIYNSLMWLIGTSKAEFESTHEAAGRRNNDFYRAFGAKRLTRKQKWHLANPPPAGFV